MIEAGRDLWETVRKPNIKKVFFASLPFNRRVLLWYADKVVKKNSAIETVERLQEIDRLRKEGQSLNFICNHLTYADSHVIETLMVRAGLGKLADHLIHVAGQKTYEIYRRFGTRSLNTVRVYQPKAKIDKQVKRKMNARALKWAAHLKRRGYSLLVFPEGTRTRRQKRFNLHAANPKTILYFRRSMVVPLALMGSENIMPVGKILPRPATVVLRVGQPIDHSKLEGELRAREPQKSETEFRHDVISHYMDQINNLLDSDYQDIHAPARD